MNFNYAEMLKRLEDIVEKKGGIETVAELSDVSVEMLGDYIDNNVELTLFDAVRITDACDTSLDTLSFGIDLYDEMSAEAQQEYRALENRFSAISEDILVALATGRPLKDKSIRALIEISSRRAKNKTIEILLSIGPEANRSC